MKHNRRWLALALSGVLTLSLLAGCSSTAADTANTREDPAVEETTGSDALVIAEQGIFSAGGTVIESDGTFDVSNYYTSREGSTAHVDHEGITGNDHFMFQDLNNDVIAGHIENWIQQNVQ